MIGVSSCRSKTVKTKGSWAINWFPRSRPGIFSTICPIPDSNLIVTFCINSPSDTPDGELNIFQFFSVNGVFNPMLLSMLLPFSDTRIILFGIIIVVLPSFNF
uniref:(northern house mosquito) hypothetical protein n=1 Tax=Culex pipiens TaxID=7175 RepID=A0A8D8BF09_CULPI